MNSPARERLAFREPKSLKSEVNSTEWVLVPELQGRRTSLMVGLSFDEEEGVTAVAQWSTKTPGRRPDNYMQIATEPDEVMRVLTFARLAIEKGLA